MWSVLCSIDNNNNTRILDMVSSYVKCLCSRTQTFHIGRNHIEDSCLLLLSVAYLITLHHFKGWKGIILVERCHSILLHAWQRILVTVCEPLFHSVVAWRAQCLALRPVQWIFEQSIRPQNNSVNLFSLMVGLWIIIQVQTLLYLNKNLGRSVSLEWLWILPPICIRCRMGWSRGSQIFQDCNYWSFNLEAEQLPWMIPNSQSSDHDICWCETATSWIFIDLYTWSNICKTFSNGMTTFYQSDYVLLLSFCPIDHNHKQFECG